MSLLVKNSNLNRPFRRVVSFALGLKCSFDLYDNVKQYGYNDYAIRNIAIIICLIILFILDLVYAKNRRDIPKRINIIIIAIILIVVIITLIL